MRVTIPLRAQQRSCLLLPRAVLHFRTLPPAAATMASARQSTEHFCIACFRSGPRRSESARLAAGTDAAHTLCALRCWTLLTQPLPAPRRLPYGSLRLWACATMTVSSRRALSLHACVTARDVSRALRAATAAPLRCRAQVCEVAGILLKIVAPRLLERGVGVLRADVGREVLLVEGEAALLAANRPPLDRH